jgi:hypothetical protein
MYDCHRLIVALICIVLAGTASVGRASSFSTLNIDFLGRGGMHGMAGRLGDVDNVVWNPSGLGRADGDQGYASYMDYVVGVRGGTAGYRGNWRSTGYGVYISYISSGTIARTGWTDPTGGLGASYSHTEMILGASQGLEVLPNLWLGSGLKLVRLNLDDLVSSGAFVDVSATVQVLPWRAGKASGYSVRTALIARNLGLLSWGEEIGQAPLNAELALSFGSPEERLSMGLSLVAGRDGRREVRGGISALLSDEFEVRLGYRRRVGRMADSEAGLPWQRGLVGGFGIGFGSLWLDYSYEDASPLGGIHRLGLRARLGRAR